MAKGIRANIYKHNGNDYSNKGISSRCDSVTIVSEHTNIVQREETPEAPAVKIVIRNLANGQTLLHAEPNEAADGVGWMAGGTYINIDQLNIPGVPFYGLIALHDRTESVEEYAMFSN